MTLLAWMIRNPLGRLLARCPLTRWVMRKLIARSVRKSVAGVLVVWAGRDVAEDPVGKAVARRLAGSTLRRALDQTVERASDRVLRAAAS